jgi:hypothetical protein
MKINGLINIPRWYAIKCKCGIDAESKYPLVDCLHCKFEECENSLPKKNFSVKIKDKNKKIIDKTITEITIVRGSKYEDVIGWTY